MRGRNLIQKSFPNPKMPPHLSRAWVSMHDARHLWEPFSEALKLLKIKHEAPGWFRDLLCSISIPSKKIAIATSNDRHLSSHSERSELWGKYGWAYVRIRPTDFRGIPIAEIAEIMKKEILR